MGQFLWGINVLFEYHILWSWCLSTVTFGQKSSKSNSRPVYSSQLYGMHYADCSWLYRLPFIPKMAQFSFVSPFGSFGAQDWKFSFPNETEELRAETQFSSWSSSDHPIHDAAFELFFNRSTAICCWASVSSWTKCPRTFWHKVNAVV